MSVSLALSNEINVCNVSGNGKIEFDEKLIFNDIQLYVQNPNKTFSLRCNDKGNKYISVGHNLKYNKNLDDIISKIDKIDFKSKLSSYDKKYESYEVKNIYNISKNGDKYVNFYINFIKRFENDTKYDNLKILVKDEEKYFETLDEFIKFVDNKYLNYNMTMYLNIFINNDLKRITLRPCIYSMNFNLEPKINNTLINFINMSSIEQKKVLDPYINESLSNRDFSKMKNPCFVFRGLKFRLPTLDMSKYKDYTLPKKFKPSSWIGKQEKLEKDAPGKEYFKIVCDDNLQKFIDILENYFKENFDKFEDVFLNEMRKSKKNPNGFNIKLTKKDNIEILMPVTYHEEIKEIKDEEGIIIDEELVENGLTMNLLKIMQPSIDDENENSWKKIPKNLNYKMMNPTIFVNKLFYYEKDKTFRLQLSFSKYLDIKENSLSTNQDPTYKSLLDLENNKIKKVENDIEPNNNEEEYNESEIDDNNESDSN